MMTATPVFDQVWPLKYSGVDSGARPPAVQHLASGRCHQADGSWRAGLFSAVVEDARRTFRAILDGENRKTDLTSLRGSDSRPKSGPEEDEFKHSGLRTRGSGRQSPKSTAAAAGRISWPTSARFRRFRGQDRASELSPYNSWMLIREEVPHDRAGIDDVVRAAFGRSAEAMLVDQLRADSDGVIFLGCCRSCVDHRSCHALKDESAIQSAWPRTIVGSAPTAKIRCW